MTKKYLELKDIGAYNKAFELSNNVWNFVLTWDYFAKDTIGKQLVKSVDSISANVAEGFGRYYKKDKIHFYRYSYGSLSESMDWIEKARERRLLKMEKYQEVIAKLKDMFRELKALINFTEEKLSF